MRSCAPVESADQTAAHPGDPRDVLLISGVNISQPPLTGDHPTPDYAPLIAALRPAVLDTRTIAAVRHPLVAQVRRVAGPQWAIAVAALLGRRRYRAIIATGEDVGLRLAWLLRLRRARIPLLVTCHNIATRRPSFFLNRLRVGPWVHTFQCLSEAQARLLTERFRIDPAQIQLLTWHVDARFFRPLPEAPLRRQICSAGMASRDYATLVAAARDLDVAVKIAADSPWFKQRLNITAADLPANVELCDLKTYANLRRLYAESLFVVVPLLDVPFAAGYTVILEAMAMGKAVIVTRTRQPSDFIVDGWNGLLVAPGNGGELRDRMRWLIDHPAEARRMGANARAVVEQRFTLDHYVQRMQAALQAAAPRPSSQAGVYVEP